MLILKVSLRDIGYKFEQEAKLVKAGGGRIEAFASDLIVMSLHEAAGITEIWIGEDVDPFIPVVGRPDAADDYRTFARYEGIKCRTVVGDQGPRIELFRTAAGTCPIYIACNGETLVASWKFEDAARLHDRPLPDIESCRIYLEHGPGQIRNQVIAGVSMLWPGESLSFSDHGVEFREIDTPEIVLPSTLRESARVTDAFIELIAGALEPTFSRSAQPLVEISGGLDSSCVAIAAASVREGMHSYGVIHEGAVGAQQRARRRELVELLGVGDFEFPAFEHPPFAALKVDECALTPFDDMYRLPCVYAIDAHPAGSFDLVVTGIGGDELTMENTFFRQEWEVRGSVCTSSIVAATARADMFMRRGIWPLSPLVNQSVVDFCRALPASMRDKRLLNMLTIARAGIGDGFLFPRYKEHYGNIVQREAALFDFDAALRESVVADYGIVEFSPLLLEAREASNGGFSYKLITELYLLMKLETVLRTYLA